jgi:hypothetical protein
MSLTNVWLRTLDDEIIRADQVVGIHSHYTPALVGKPACWLVDVFLLTPLGNGRPDGRGISALHRTLIQTPHAPTGAPATLARLLAQLDAIHATGVITTTIATVAPATSDTIAESDSTDMQIATSAPSASGSSPSPPSDSATTPDPNTSNHRQRGVGSDRCVGDVVNSQTQGRGIQGDRKTG